MNILIHGLIVMCLHGIWKILQKFGTQVGATLVFSYPLFESIWMSLLMSTAVLIACISQTVIAFNKEALESQRQAELEAGIHIRPSRLKDSEQNIAVLLAKGGLLFAVPVLLCMITSIVMNKPVLWFILTGMLIGAVSICWIGLVKIKHIARSFRNWYADRNFLPRRR